MNKNALAKVKKKHEAWKRYMNTNLRSILGIHQSKKSGEVGN